MARVGQGFDVHKFVLNKRLIIGGVTIDHDYGLEGHSDADVLIHVICDAVLGAADLRDVGFHFPDTDPKYKGIDSKKLLKEVFSLLRNKGYELGNLDTTICLELPKVNPHIPEMKKCLAKVMDIEENQISIKATTTEKLSFVGRQEGVSAYATALIFKN